MKAPLRGSLHRGPPPSLLRIFGAMLPVIFVMSISIKELEDGTAMKLIPLGAAAGVAAVIWIGSAGPAAATWSATRPQGMQSNSLSDCWVTGSAPSASANVVSFMTFVYCDTVVDYLQAQVNLTTLVGGVVQTVPGGAWCVTSSTSEFTCTATASCQGGSYYGGFADVVETNAVGYSTEETWNQPPVWVAC